MPVVLIALYSAGVIPLWKETAIGMLLGVMMIMYAGIWMEKHLPGLSAKIALLAPACFLTFMLHWPIYGFLPPAMKSSLFAFFTPLLVFAAIVLFYFALKRFAPFLLPYLAHVKNTGRRQAQHGACDETIPLIRGLSGMSQSSERDAGKGVAGRMEKFRKRFPLFRQRRFSKRLSSSQGPAGWKSVLPETGNGGNIPPL